MKFSRLETIYFLTAFIVNESSEIRGPYKTLRASKRKPKLKTTRSEKQVIYS